ncbi:MAG: hypothetical protein IT381_06820 [Deltaproteobacteria bacterium]|nr:hypothetical protein [Deltaproteobacteria bacterium]
MSFGIAPKILLEQVRNTAAWALEPGFTTHSYPRALLAADALEHTWQTHEGRFDYFRMLLAAHYTTCATFIPTDVDNRIRFHFWQELHTEDDLRRGIAVLNEASGWPAPEVSEGCIVDPELGAVSGHDGEWLGVRAGALGRAHALGLTALATSLRDELEAEVLREAKIMTRLVQKKGAEIDALCAMASVAHNIGDLARVCDMWAAEGQAQLVDRLRFTAIPKDPVQPFGRLFIVIGEAYKDLLSDSNHRYLPLREPKGLRRARDMIRPFGPFLDAWGERIGRHPMLGERDHADFLGALLAGHERSPEERGYPRAIAGLNRALKGGVDRLASDVPARLRKVLRAGPLRAALDLDARRFDERMRARYTSHFLAPLRACSLTV